MAILKYIYLSLGLILYIFFNYLSYTHPAFSGDLLTKVLFSLISLVLLSFDYIVILKSEWIFKKTFKNFTTYTKIMLYLGIIITPLISLYYQS